MIAKQESKVGSDCEGGKRRRASAGGSIASPPLNGVLSPAVIHDNSPQTKITGLLLMDRRWCGGVYKKSLMYAPVAPKASLAWLPLCNGAHDSVIVFG